MVGVISNNDCDSAAMTETVAVEESEDTRNPTPSNEEESGTDRLEDETDAEAGPSRQDHVFEGFLAACSLRLRLPDDEKIIQKLSKHYHEINPEFRLSDECESLLEGFISQVKEQPDTYVILSEVLRNFKSFKTRSNPAEKNKARIKQLEKYLEKVDQKIKELQEKEVNFDEEENSDYILESRLKERFAKVYKELCRLVGASATEPRARVTFNGTRYPEINRNIRKYVNRRKDEFPDFSTILNIVDATNQEEGLHLTEESISQIAREAFEGVGMELKKRRLKEFKTTFGCHLTDSVDGEDDDSRDPASADPVLKEKLEQNQAIGNKRLDELLDKFAVEQEIRREEAVEVNDDENVSVEDSDDEDEEEEEAATDDIDKLIEGGTPPPDATPEVNSQKSPDSKVNGTATLPTSGNSSKPEPGPSEPTEPESAPATNGVKYKPGPKCSKSPNRVLKRPKDSSASDDEVNLPPAKKWAPSQPDDGEPDIIVLD